MSRTSSRLTLEFLDFMELHVDMIGSKDQTGAFHHRQSRRHVSGEPRVKQSIRLWRVIVYMKGVCLVD